MNKMEVIESLDQGGTIALYDGETNQRTTWLLYEDDLPMTKENCEDYISNQDYEWVDASDLENEIGQILYRVID